MKKFALSAATVAFVAGFAGAALADRPPTAAERAAIESALSAQGYTSWGKIEWDDGRWEVEDARGADGRLWDLDLNSSLAIIKKELED